MHWTATCAAVYHTLQHTLCCKHFVNNECQGRRTGGLGTRERLKCDGAVLHNVQHRRHLLQQLQHRREGQSSAHRTWPRTCNHLT